MTRWTAPLAERWQRLAPREQGLLRIAAALLALALLWWVALAPALQTLRSAPDRHAALDRQLRHMQALQAEAQQLQSAPAPRGGDAQAALRTSLAQQLGGTAQWQALGERATVTLQGAPAAGLALWLAEARSNAQALPVEARLSRSAAAPAGAAPAPAGRGAGETAAPSPRWDGTLVLALPAR